MEKQPVVLVDGMILAHAVNATLGWMKTKAGVPTGLPFGFFRSLLSYQKQFNARQMVIAWDLPGQILKAEGTAEYKADRTYSEADRSMFSQLPQLREVIGLTKWDQLILSGYEADDLIAAYAATAEKPVVIVTNDQDLQQNLQPGVVIWMTRRKKFMTGPDVRAEWGVNPNQMALLRAGLGDKSDNLEPVVAKEFQEAFKQILIANPGITDTKHLNWRLTTFPVPFGINLGALAERERLMKPNFPPSMEPATIKGTPDAAALEAVFISMESKTLRGQLSKMT